MILKLNKEYVKQISLAICGFLLIGIGYLNYSLDLKKNDNDEIARQSLNEKVGKIKKKFCKSRDS